jgi:gliding motility-associated-like protein
VIPCCEEINIPNLFTPNGDDHNEYFVIGCLGSGGWNLSVYNRWGGLVYTNPDYDNKWDGKDLADGVYYYYLTKEGKKSYNSWVQIVR